MNSYQHTMLIENICYAGNLNDKQLPDKISKYVDANDIREIHTLVQQIEQKEIHYTDQGSLFKNLQSSYKVQR